MFKRTFGTVTKFKNGILEIGNKSIPVVGSYEGHIERIRFSLQPSEGNWGTDIIKEGAEVTLVQKEDGETTVNGLISSTKAARNTNKEIIIQKAVE